jgi:2-keto-3-deoxy-L-rhamnonate aldolase RhmA
MNRLQQAVEKNGGAPLLGAAAYIYNPAFFEMAALLGYQAAWVEMEHTFHSFEQAADLCRLSSALGMLTMLRIPDLQRGTILKGCECGPDILDLPMVNTPEMACELVTQARFPPQGVRGFFGVSRAVQYGIPGKVPDIQQKLNEELCLMIQIETKEAAERIDELCEVPGIDAIFIGPADLSASLGVAGQTSHPTVQETAARVIRSAKKHGQQVATAAPAGEARFWIEQGVDLYFCVNDLSCMKAGAQSALSEVKSMFGR